MKSLLCILTGCVLGMSTAQVLRYSPAGPSGPTGISYTIIPAQPNTTGTISDIYLQIQGPATNSWIALGQGLSMRGSQMFIIYANAAGTNVTVSQRLGIGHREPTAETTPNNIVLLAGSSITNGNMTANILCQKCDIWPDGGAMNFNDTDQPFIWAAKTGDPVHSDSTFAHIMQHDDGSYAAFTLDLRSLARATSSNPFLDLASNSSQIIDTSSSVYDGAAIPFHGVVMCLAFVIGFPLGAFLIRLASFRGLVWIHGVFQMLSYLGAIVGLGLGVYIARKGAADISAFHAVFGIVVVVLLLFQPILGYVHHLHYQRYQSITPYTHAHVWYGRVLVSAGLLDGFFGLLLAGQGAGILAAYGIIAGGVWVLWILVVVFTGRRQKRKKIQTNDIRMAALVDERDGRVGNGGMYNGA